MDVVLVVLRLLHIVSAAIWFGLGMTLTLFVLPAMLRAGDGGLRAMKSIMVQTSVDKLIPAVSGLTTLAGLLLYATGSHTRFTTLGNIVLGIGALAGLAATIHGGAVTGRATKALEQGLTAHVTDGGALSVDARGVVEGLTNDLITHSRISLYLMIVALVGMGSARYL